MTISFSDDILSRYAGSASSESPEDAERGYRIRAAGRTEDAALAAESAFNASHAELKSKNVWNTPAGTAVSTPSRIANIVSKVAGGEMTDAYTLYNEVESDASRFSAENVDRAATRPANNEDAALQAAYQMMATRSYRATELTLPDGKKTTLGAFFEDGESYKTYETDPILRKTFSARSVDLYRNGTNDQKRVMSMCIDEPLAYATARRGAESHPYRLQRRDIADYAAKGWDDLVQELGQGGLEHIVDTAVNSYAAVGIARDYLDTVRNCVLGQKTFVGTGDELENVVRSVSDQYGRMLKTFATTNDGRIDQSRARLVAKTMKAVAEDSSGRVDFDDLDVRDACDRMFTTVAQFERLRVPLLADGIEGGAAIRRGMADAVRSGQLGRSPLDTNFFARAQSALTLISGLLSGGCVPLNRQATSDPRDGDDVPSMPLGATSGNTSVDYARKMMASALLSKFVIPGISRGIREDVAVSKALAAESRADLIDAWTPGLSMSLGISRKTASVLASHFADRLSASGGASQLDIVKAISDFAFSADNDSLERRDAMRWLKANTLEQAGADKAVEQYRSLLYDPDFGIQAKTPGQVKQIAESMIEVAKNRVIAAMEKGTTPSLVAAELAKIGTVPVPTGRYLDASGKPISSEEYKVLVTKAQAARKGARTMPVGLDGIRPEFTTYSGDLNKLKLPALEFPDLGVSLPEVSVGSWSDPIARERLRAHVRTYRKIIADMDYAAKGKQAEMYKNQVDPDKE